MRPLLDPVSRQGILKALLPGAWHCLQKEVLFELENLSHFQLWRKTWRFGAPPN